MWLNKSVAKINAMFKILDIMSFRYIYIYIYMYRCVCVCVCVYFNNFGFRISAFNLNIAFLVM